MDSVVVSSQHSRDQIDLDSMLTQDIEGLRSSKPVLAEIIRRGAVRQPTSTSPTTKLY